MSPNSSLISAIFANSNKNKKFSFWTSAYKIGDGINEGKLFIGEDDTSLAKYHTGNITYVNLTSLDKWEFTMNRISIPGLIMCTNCNVSLSTKLISISGPANIIQQFNDKIGAISISADKEQKVIKCSQIPYLPSKHK